MKKSITISAFFVSLTCHLTAQTTPQGNPPATNTADRAAAAWYRGGNQPIGTVPTGANIFGTLWNSPIYTQTNAINRTKLNGTFSYMVNGSMQPRDGYMFIGPNAVGSSNLNSFIYQDRGAFSLLHLNGTGVIQEFGFRSWMKTGITLTDNTDMAYMGLRKVGSLANTEITEMVINWTDNDAGAPYGPDDFAFRFTTAGAGNPVINQNDVRTSTDLDGLHIARFTPTGLIGFGSTFGVNAPDTPLNLYVRPQSLLHLSYDWKTGVANEPYGFMQITSRRSITALNDSIGQGEAVTDGLRFGIDNDVFGAVNRRHLNSYLRWQEASSFVIQTEDGGAPNIQNNERLRVTSIGALTRNYTTNEYIGLRANTTNPSDVTRISIAHSGFDGLTRPMSLLHLGYNIGSGFGAIQFQRGWRPWMDLGMLVSNTTDNIWIGLKPRTGTATQANDKLDAVINWGNNGNDPVNGTDVMRFIFTADSLSIQDTASAAIMPDGLEIMRLYPKVDTTTTLLGKTHGRVGIGDFTALGVNGQPTHKLDVVGNGRFRALPDAIYEADSTVTKTVMVDESGVLRWTATPLSGFGSICSDTTANIFAVDRKVNLNNNSFYFEGNNATNNENNVGFGWACGTPLKAKVDAISYGTGGLAGSFVTIENWTSGLNSLTPTGAQGLAAGNGGGSASYYGVRGQALGSNHNGNYAIYGTAPSAINSYAGYFNGDVQAGGTFISSDSTLKNQVNPLKGALTIVNKLAPKTYYMDVDGYPDFNFSTELQYGFLAQEVQAVLPSLVKQSVQPGSFDESGELIANPTSYLSLNYNAIIPINTQAIIELNEKVNKATLSDQSIKTNVQDLNGSLDKVLLMRGVSYDWNHNILPQLNLDSANHVGFIAQEMAQVDPRLTYLDDDSLLHVEYDKVVPILAEAIEELNNTVEQKDSIINDLNNRLTQLENCLSGILPMLCQMSQSMVESNTIAEQEAVRAQLSVQLSNRTSIVLDQNVPNPFAEQTVINFSIPATVQKAQIHFYDGLGKLIQSVDVVERGLGSLTVFGSDLSQGTYTYTLVADGQIVSTKKMMKQ